MLELLLVIFTLLWCFQQSSSFQIVTKISRKHVYTNSILMHFEEAINGNSLLNSKSLLPDRYLATNRFKVRPNQEAKFEKRWADRKSRLSQLEGFRLFSLFRQIESQAEIFKLSPLIAVEKNEKDSFNYISFTIWKNKENFNSWRTGEAFKEAHGGGSIIDFMKLIGTALFIIDGSPKPAFYDCLRYQTSTNPATSSLVSPYVSAEGWRSLEADGNSVLNPEVFLSQFTYKVTNPNDFEQEITMEMSSVIKSSEAQGLLVSTVLRRDADKADDDYNYILNMIWTNKESYIKFMSCSEGNVLKRITAPNAMFYQGSPSPAFYEGKLTLIDKSEILPRDIGSDATLKDSKQTATLKVLQ